MKKAFFDIKVLKIVMKSKMLRILTVLSIAALIISIALISVSVSYNRKIAANDVEIEKAQEQLSTLQLLVSTGDEEEIQQKIGNKEFATYEEVVPFIGLLESLFAIIDKEASILVKTTEDQIFMDHYADYEVNLELKNNKELFYKALDQLHNSRYITRILSYNLNYKPESEGTRNTLTEVSFVIRLYFE